MRIKALTTLAAALCLLVQTAAARDYAAEKYHIVGDGTTMNTAAIQQLVDRVSREGGGRIVFGHGRYLTGSFHMRSNVEVHVERGATILGSTSPFDYFNVTAHSGSETDRMDNAHLGLFVSHRARNISFTGEGTIDGQGLALALAADSLHHAGAYVDAHYNTRRMRPSELVRPTLFYLAETDGIRIEQLHLRNSSNWGLSFNMSRNITIRGIDLHNRAYWNNDGIDLTDCQRVTVTGCCINSADDGICLKSYNPDSGNDSIDVSHCEIRSSASAIKFGTGSYGGFRHVSIRHIRVLDTFRSAIAIESVDGAIIEHVSVEDVVATNTGNPIFIRLGQRAGQRPGPFATSGSRTSSCRCLSDGPMPTTTCVARRSTSSTTPCLRPSAASRATASRMSSWRTFASSAPVAPPRAWPICRSGGSTVCPSASRITRSLPCSASCLHGDFTCATCGD